MIGNSWIKAPKKLYTKEQLSKAMADSIIKQRAMDLVKIDSNGNWHIKV